MPGPRLGYPRGPWLRTYGGIAVDPPTVDCALFSGGPGGSPQPRVAAAGSDHSLQGACLRSDVCGLGGTRILPNSAVQGIPRIWLHAARPHGDLHAGGGIFGRVLGTRAVVWVRGGAGRAASRPDLSGLLSVG